uniref:Uncharacterized protein sfmI n=1 Tax=Streptomyces lavendulae TaxID=1914 RepID=B0CN19_STRLA|nr:hypothetical protein [Streptomyces lavendulae]
MSVWHKIDDYLHLFSSPVLSFRDPDGFPFSLRCRPRQDRDTGLMVVRLPEGVPAAEGPAWLLWHSHDEEFGSLQALAVSGDLAAHGDGWSFRPRRVLPGPGLGPGGWAGVVEKIERDTARFLEERNLTAPQDIDWAALERIAESARKDNEERARAWAELP